MMNLNYLIIDSHTTYNRYINNNKINNFPIVINYTINYFNHYYPFNVYIHRDINHFISLSFNFFEVGNFDPPDRNGGALQEKIALTHATLFSLFSLLFTIIIILLLSLLYCQFKSLLNYQLKPSIAK